MKNRAASQLGKLGAKARNDALSDSEKSQIAKNAANVRWAEYRRKKRQADEISKRPPNASY